MPAESLILSREASKALAERVYRMVQGPGQVHVVIRSTWNGFARWGRNRVVLAGDQRRSTVQITRYHLGATGMASTDQLGDAALAAAVRSAERTMHSRPTGPDDFPTPPRPTPAYPKTSIWSDATATMTSKLRGEVARSMVEAAETAGMLSAGYCAAEAASLGIFSTGGIELYAPSTSAQCSLTVRDSRGTGSGWAGGSSYDWTRIDPRALGATALEKCLTSRDPVAIEPGRYTVILEPQAVGDLMNFMIRPGQDYVERMPPEMMGMGPFADRPGFSKLGQLVADPRLTISHDPSDPELGVIPFGDDGEPHRPVTWIDRGVLINLAYDRGYALRELNEDEGRIDSGAFRMTGGETTVPEMISTTRRGLLVTRFSSMWEGRGNRLTGVTRDGLWLIENGKVSKAVKNLRFTQQLLVALSSIEQLGRPVPVYRPGFPLIVPPLKIRDFSFTSLADAV